MCAKIEIFAGVVWQNEGAHFTQAPMTVRGGSTAAMLFVLLQLMLLQWQVECLLTAYCRGRWAELSACS